MIGKKANIPGKNIQARISNSHKRIKAIQRILLEKIYQWA